MKFLCTLALPLLFGLVGCRSVRPYEAADFDPTRILNDLERARPQPAAAGTELTLQQLGAWMQDWHPELRELRIAYAGLAELTRVPAPRPNPTLEIGLAQGFNADDRSASLTQPFIAFGFALPLGTQLADTDSLTAAEAEAARVAVIARYRELYMGMRSVFLRYAKTQERRQLLTQLGDDLGAARKITEQLIALGAASGLDVGLLDLDLGKLELARLGLESELADACAELATYTGLPPATFAASPAICPPRAPLPEESALRGLLLANSPELARLQAAFAVADCQLRLELARQRPDLEFAVEAEQETGGTKREVRLAAGAELPIHDRNQQQIVVAEQARRMAKAQYESTLSRKLAELTIARDRLALIQRRQALIRDRLEPQAEANLLSARRLAEAGQFSAMAYLEVLRGQRDLQVAAYEAELALLTGELELEELIGVPLPRTDATESLPSWNQQIEGD